MVWSDVACDLLVTPTWVHHLTVDFTKDVLGTQVAKHDMPETTQLRGRIPAEVYRLGRRCPQGTTHVSAVSTSPGLLQTHFNATWRGLPEPDMSSSQSTPPGPECPAVSLCLP